MAVITLQDRPSISEGDFRPIRINYTPILDSGELLILAGLDISEIGSAHLTLQSKIINTSAVRIKRSQVAIGKAVLFTATNAQSGNLYRIRITVTTDTAQILVRDLLLNCP